MRLFSPGKLIAIGFLMVILGFILPLLMVLQELEASFLWIFIAYALSGGGLLLGFAGAAFIVIGSRHKKRDRDRDHEEWD